MSDTSGNPVEGLNEDLLMEYAGLKTQEKEIAQKIKEKSPLVLAELSRVAVDKVQKKGVGSFSISISTKYDYSEIPDIVATEEKLEQLKTEAKQTGTAKPVETRIIKFISEKVREEVEE